MAFTRSAGSRRMMLLATALSATLTGCASVEYAKVEDESGKAKVVPVPQALAQTTPSTMPVAAGGPTVAAADAMANGTDMAQYTVPNMVPVPSPNPLLNPRATTTVAALQPVNATMPGQPVVAPLAYGQIQPQAATELAYATPTVVAIPQPRPDIIAAANSLPDPTAMPSTFVSSADNSAQKDVKMLAQRLASAQPMPGNPNPLVNGIAVPQPRPDMPAMGLEAYANTPAMMAMDAFDTSGPKDVITPEATGIAPSGKLQELIHKYATLYNVPEALVHRVVKRESRYNPNAYSRGNYGLMQIRYNTARGLGYTGTPAGLFDAETNLKYAVKYLRGAFMVAENNHDNAVKLYARGYYFDAKRKGMLDEVQ